MKVELFKLGANRMVDLNKDWISTIKEFKKILIRDKGSKGDIEGRKKLQATKEITFIYHYCDYESKFGNYSEEDKAKECAKNSDLPEGYDFRKDEDMLAAVAKYKSLQETPALKLLTEAKEGLHTAHKVIRKIRTSLETKLEATDFDELEVVEEKGKTRITDPITKLTNNLKALMELTNQVGPALKNIKELEEEIKKELGDKASLRGGREKGMREDAKSRTLPIPDKDEDESSLESTGTAGIFSDL